MTDKAHRLAIARELDLVPARRYVRELGLMQGLSAPSIEALATAVTEVARNVIVHAGRGEMLVEAVVEHSRRGVAVTVTDQGPGIADIELAMRDGYSTGDGLGSGLPGSQRLVDDFSIVSTSGSGTTVILRQWQKTRP